MNGLIYKSKLRHQKELHWYTFFAALITATAFFIPFIISDHGYFLFYGDFNVQQIPFYKMCHEMVKSGEIFWNWNTDLGANFVGSYSFYLLGSPFFWLTLPFPTWMLPYLMGPLLILKFACAALTGYLFIRRFTKRPETAMIGAMLYAFSGFSIYNIFFNHFHEAIIFFPLLLLGVELFIAENRRGVLAFAVFICAISNYFFFAGMAVFCIIYWFIRMYTGGWDFNIKRFAFFLLEILIGVGLAACLLVPSFFAVIQNSRVSEHSWGWGAILYGKEQIYPNIFEVFFFPPDIPARPVFFPDADVKWSSLGGWLPVFSMVGVISWLQSKKGTWQKRLLITLIVMSLVPVLNSAFYMFNSAYYARWYYMPILIMCLVTVMSLEDKTVDWNKGFKWTAVITAVFTIVIGLFPGKEENGVITQWGLFSADSGGDYTYLARFWITCGIAIGGLVILKLLLNMKKKKPEAFYNAAILCICVVTVIYSAFFIGSGKSHGYDSKTVMIPELLEAQVELPGDKDTYRIDVYDGVDNTGMYLGYQCIQAFHSIVPNSVMEYYPYVGVDRGVGSRPEVKTYAIRPFLSVKYVLARSGVSFTEGDNGDTKMPGYIYIDEQDGYKIYENMNFIPYGFTYDYYISRAQADAYSEDDRSLLMLKAMILDEEQIARHKDILKDISTYNNTSGSSKNNYIPATPEDANYGAPEAPDLPDLTFDKTEYKKDCKALAATAAKDFKIDSRGFTAEVDLEKDDLVFFSVPYEGGWSATVDNDPAVIENVNVGFMAVRVGEGAHTIRFEYMTPGLNTGVITSVVSLLLLVGYLAVCYTLKKRNPSAWTAEYPEGKALFARFAKEDRAEERAEKARIAAEAELAGLYAENQMGTSPYEQIGLIGFHAKETGEDDRRTEEDKSVPEDEASGDGAGQTPADEGNSGRYESFTAGFSVNLVPEEHFDTQPDDDTKNENQEDKK